MTKKIASEHYSNAPIIEALIDIQVSMPNDFNREVLEKLALQLADKFPVKNEIASFGFTMEFQTEGLEQQVAPSQSHQVLGFKLNDNENKKILQLKESGFTFSLLKPYSDWDSFSEEAKECWTLFLEYCKPEKVTRCALRYINRIDIPFQTIEMEKYLNLYPNLPEMKDIPAVIASMQMNLLIPQDELGVAVINQAVVDPYKNDGFSILLDIDLFKLVSLSPDSENVWGLLSKQRARKNDLFEYFITDKTRELIT